MYSGNHVGGLTGGYHQQGLQQPVDAHGFAHHQVACGRGLTEIFKGGGRYGHNVLGITVFQAQIRSHDFGGAGGIILLVGLVLVQGYTGVHIHEIGGVSSDRNIVRSGGVLLNEQIAGSGGNEESGHEHQGQQQGKQSFHVDRLFFSLFILRKIPIILSEIYGEVKAIPHKTAREFDERFSAGKRWETAGVHNGAFLSRQSVVY